MKLLSKIRKIITKKTLIIGVIAIGSCLVICGVVVLCKHLYLNKTGTGNGRNVIVTDSVKKVKIVDSEVFNMEYETYDNGLITLEIPKGWKVDIAPADYIHYTFKLYNPEKPEYFLIYTLKQEGFLKSEKARSTYETMYPDAVFSLLSPIEPQTTEAFYKVWHNNARLANEKDFKRDFYPMLNEFNVIENLGTSMLGGDILRATYVDDNNNLMQGLFTATVADVGTYMISENMWNPFGPTVDVAPLNVYNIIFMSSPDTEFNDWQQIFDYSLSTMEFTDEFVRRFNSEEANLVATVQANQRIYDQISNMIMDSWEKRSSSYDIISQKQSDATLGYERVYDTETGDVYKAYNGFTDDYSGERFQPITDDMYTSYISGYIEK